MPLDKSRDYPKDACVGPYWLVRDDSEKVMPIFSAVGIVTGLFTRFVTWTMGVVAIREPTST
jgi:hypothetical protein